MALPNPDTLVNLPGVKIREVQLVGPPIAGAATSTPGFVGVAPKIAKRRHENVPNLVTSADQFFRDYINYPVTDPLDPDKPPDKAEATESTPLSHAVLGYFQNGGGPCYVVDVGDGGDVTKGIEKLERVDVQIIAAPGNADNTVYGALIDQAENARDRFAILDPPDDPNTTVQDLLKGGGKRPDKDSMWAAFYYPQIQVLPVLQNDPKPKDEKIWVAPTGHIAGVYARVDALRGVHKAPANEVLLGAQAVQYVINDADQDSLNKDGVNAIRLFSQGPTVFGARTFQDHTQDTTFRYINVRRLVTYIEQSLRVGLRFAIFEPNNLALRQKIARSVRGFLDGVWRDGALFGATADQAYYVRFPDAFNTDDDRALGKLTIEIGLRATYPAEFIIVRIGLILQSPTS
jgi:phage tail sheath protein FI